MKIYFIAFLSLLLSQTLSAQVIAEAFPGCLQVDIQEGQACGGGGSFFGINGSDQFEVNNIDGIDCCLFGGMDGGDGLSYFQMEEMDISCFEDVFINLDYSARPENYEDDFPAAPHFAGCFNSNLDNGHDQIVFTYILDGAPEVVDLYAHGTSEVDFTGTWNTGPFNGNTLTIKIYASNKASAEAFYFENLQVSATDAVVSAGPDDTYCFDDPIVLGGSGSGTWSGGAGSFSDNMDPNAIYTPDASEANTTITLEYIGCEATDNCENRDEVDITIVQPDIDAISITECSDDLDAYDLTQHNNDVSTDGTVTWFDGDPTSGGSMIANASNANINPPLDLYAQVTDGDGCTNSIAISVTSNESPTASIDQASADHELCLGECSEISFNFSGGTAPYNLQLSFGISLIPFPLEFPIPGFPVSNTINICYDGTGFIPTVSGNTITIPEIAAGISGTLSLVSFTDANLCAGTVNGTGFQIDFLATPTAFPDELMECDLGDGTGDFDLTEADATVSGGAGGTVRYYSDAALTNEIASPYNSPTATVYAVLDNGQCVSEPAEVDLVVNLAEVGVVIISCDPNTTSDFCSICDDDSFLSEEITIYFEFEDNIEYEIVLNHGGDTDTYTLDGPSDNLDFDITEDTEFEIISITPLGGCADLTDLGGIVDIQYNVEPIINFIDTQVGCGQVELPFITGFFIGSNFGYSSAPNQMGDLYNEGDIITEDMTLYVYAGNNDCFDEFAVDIDIQDGVAFDVPDDVNVCDSYTLLPITGTDVSASAAYFTQQGGGGTMYNAGDIIPTSIIPMYLFDPNSNCGLGGDPSFNITINPTPELDASIDIDTCGIFILPAIEGTNLSGSQTYYTEIDATGDMLAVGDTIFNSDTIFLYDANDICIDQLEWEILINDGAMAGIGDTIAICKDGPLLVDLPGLLTTVADTAGIWSDDQGILSLTSDSTMIDLSIFEGIVNFMYVIEDTICGSDTSHLQINVVNALNAGIDRSVERCAGGDYAPINIPGLLGPNDLTGDYINVDAIDIDLADPTQVDLSAVAEGIYQIQYILPSDTICTPDTSILTLTIGPRLSAGDNNSKLACDGTTVDLNSILLNADGGGTFSDPFGHGGLTGTMVNTSLVTPNGAMTYDYLYIIDVAQPCDIMRDSAIVTVVVTDNVFAGDPVVDSICDIGNIMLADYLANNASSGGSFTNEATSITVPGGVFNATSSGVYNFSYTVGDNITCVESSTTMRLTVVEKPIIDINVLAEEICEGDSVFVLFSYNYQPGLDITLGVMSGTMRDNGEDPILIPFVDNDPPLLASEAITVGYDTDDNNIIDFEANEWYYFSFENISRADCDYDFVGVVDSFYINSLDSLVVDDTLCAGETRTIAGITYDMDFPSGSAIIDRTDDCDSLITIDLHFLPNSTILIDDVLCTGEFITVNGVVYNGLNPFGEENLIAANGCDSTVMIDLTFDDVKIFDATETICPGETRTYNGVVYGEGNLVGDEFLVGASVSGCDSMININLTLADIPTFLDERELCRGESVTINGVVYNQDNLAGSTPLIGAAASGCDSIVNVQITLLEPPVFIDERDLCRGESVTINGVVYDEGNLVGSTPLAGAAANGCDSFVNVQITLLESSSFLDERNLCDGESITINGVLYDENNLTGSTPFIGAAASGCDSIVNVQITMLEPSTFLNEIELCMGESMTINGVVYDENNLSGSTPLSGAAASGCDSIIEVVVTLLETAEGEFIIGSCDPLFNETIGGVVYNMDNPTGQQLLENLATNGCDSLVTIELTFDGITADYTVEQPECPDGTDGSIIVTNIGGAGPHSYGLNGQVIEILTFPVIITVTGSGSISVTDADGCETDLDYDIMQSMSSGISYTVEDDIITITGTADLDVTEISWSPSNGLSCDECLDPTFVTEEDIVYQATISYGDGCMVNIEVPVMGETIVIPSVPEYHIPNIFSPNGDGQNDIFFILPNNVGSNLVVQMIIYDRWGNQIFLKENYITDINEGWNGLFKNQELNPGVYIYVIQVLEGEEIKTFTGDITLVK